MTALPTCREVASFLADYLENELPAERRAEFESHLSRCSPCEQYLHSYRDTIRLCREAMRAGECPDPLPPAPEPLVQAVLAAIRDKA